MERSWKSVMVESFSAPTTSTVLALPGGDETLRHGQRVDVARAGGADVEGGRVLGAEQRLEVARGGREQPVGAGGGEHDGVELARR